MEGDEIRGRRVFAKKSCPTLEASPVQNSKICSRLKAQLTRLSAELTIGLRKPLRNFVSEMLFGIRASQGVKLSNIARSLQEDIPLLKTEHRRAICKRRNWKRISANNCCGSAAAVWRATPCYAWISAMYARSMPGRWNFWIRSGMAVRERCIWATGCAASSEPQFTAANSRPSTSSFSPHAPRSLSARTTNGSPPLINCVHKPEAEASGQWTVAETAESSWSRCWSGKNALSFAPPDSAWFPRHHRVTIHHLSARCRLRHQAKIINLEI